MQLNNCYNIIGRSMFSYSKRNIAKMQQIRTTFIAALASFLIAGCGESAPKHPDTLSKGNIDISVDETYSPVIQEQLKVFDSSFPEANVNAHYKPEAECFKDFFENKARLILVTRELSANEKTFCEQNQVVPTTIALAKDAVAIVLNPSSPDTVLDVNSVKGILTGVYKKKYTVVFDNQGSSTLRYIQDSLLGGQKLGANVFAAKGNNEVIDYVSKNPDAIGFVGLSYAGTQNDSTGVNEFINKVKVAGIYNDSAGIAYKPYQAFIALKLYPFTRSLYFIHRETYPGLGTGFANFLSRERGQLIFAHAHLFPLRMNIVIRDAAINQ